MTRPYDLIVFGASGFTGRLIAEVLLHNHGVNKTLRWAMAGRSLTKLQEVRSGLGADKSLDLLAADAADAAAMGRLVAQTRAVISTVGPYQLYGNALVQACAKAGTDYVDLCGEPGWMAHMIPRLQGPAQASGARIVFSCGFDSIPFDLGVTFLQHHALQTFGVPLQRVGCRVGAMKGGPSGGTIASLLATVEAMRREPALARSMANPFALTPGFVGPTQPDGQGAWYDPLAQAWTAPFVMAAINTKNVHRTNALRGHPWGRDFVYDERVLARDKAVAHTLARQDRMQNMALAFGPVRGLLKRFVLPKPGQGPTRQQRENGHFELLFMGQTSDGRSLQARVRGDRDPGYGSTSKMVTESALCLLGDVDASMTGGGVWTAGAAMGMALVRRLQANAGLTFELLPLSAR